MSRTTVVRQAIILAAGNGDRFENGSRHSKLLTEVSGTPLLTRTLCAARAAGITDAHIVLGYDADAVRALAERFAPVGLRLHFHLNRAWRNENGLSVLAARDGVNHHPFALMMGDHVFERGLLERLIHTPVGDREALLCIDRQPCDTATAAEATKVRLDGERISDIGKELDPYDALDTGLFVCHSTIFDALEMSCASGDSTLSAGVKRLARQGLVRGVDIGGVRWCDIDTIDDLGAAERLVGLPAEASERETRSLKRTSAKAGSATL